jgi:hypothetical protein
MFDIKLDIVSSLINVDAIVYIQIALLFDGDGYFLIYKVHEHIGGLGIECSHGKVIYLMQKQNAIAVECTGI